MKNNCLYPLAELHTHLGASIPPDVLWCIAHTMGKKMPIREFSDFCDHIILSDSKKMPLDDYFTNIYHPLLDRLSSGIQATEEATYQIMSRSYRNGISLVELRNNPMKHNQDNEVDLDHLTMAMLRGMERALLEHKGLWAGLIFCIGRDLNFDKNINIIKKAMKYRKRGVVGIDIAGPATDKFRLKDYSKIFNEAREIGMGITVHTGEVKDANDMHEVLEYIKPSRIGHGILAAYDKPLMNKIKKQAVTLEICPFSNIATKAVENWDEMKFIIRTFIDNEVSFCIGSDWPEVIEKCRLDHQYETLLEKGVLSVDELKRCTKNAFSSSFIPKPGNLKAYLI